MGKKEEPSKDDSLISKTEEKLSKEVDKKLRRVSKKRLLTAVICLSIILFAVLAFIAFSKFSVTTGDELNLIVSPLEQSKAGRNSEPVVFNFEVKNDNPLQCSAECNFSLFDHKSNQSIHNSVEVLSHGQKLEKTFEVKSPEKGEGIVYYTFKASCHNIRSYICLTDGEERFKSGSAALKYALSEQDAAAKEELKPKIESLSAKSLSAVGNLQNIPIRLAQGATESEEIKSLTANATRDILDLNAKAEKLTGLWGLEEYSTAKSIYSEEDEKALSASNEILKSAYARLSELAGYRRVNLELIRSVELIKPKLLEAQSFYKKEANKENNKRLESLSARSGKVYEGYWLLNNTHSEKELGPMLRRDLDALSTALETYFEIRVELLFRTLYSKNLLLLKNSTLTNSTGSCDSLSAAASQIAAENNVSEAANESSSQARDNARRYLERIALAATIQELKSTDFEYSAGALEFARNYTTQGYEYEPNASEILTAPINNSNNEEFLANYCSANITPGDSLGINQLAGIDFQRLSEFEFAFNSSFEEPKPFILKEHSKTCCALGECKPCCEEKNCENQDYPVLFIHGHAFNNKNSPEYSLTTFAGFQEEMEGEGYLSLGQLDLANTEEGIWGLSRAPVTFKASYYYITHYNLGDYVVSVKNQDGIENYAIRLKDIIEQVKKKTGKSKVHIVAHSMGGLVAREYLELFGTASVDKLVMVNTPNHGVEGRIEKWCTLFGSQAECEDLESDSIILRRLNSKPVPSEIPVFAIRSTGCQMENNKNGDGVVTNESAYLEGAMNFEIRGNCTDSLQSDLHNNALNPKLYPEMYYTIVEILKE